MVVPLPGAAVRRRGRAGAYLRGAAGRLQGAAVRRGARRAAAPQPRREGAQAAAPGRPPSGVHRCTAADRTAHAPRPPADGDGGAVADRRCAISARAAGLTAPSARQTSTSRDRSSGTSGRARSPTRLIDSGSTATPRPSRARSASTPTSPASNAIRGRSPAVDSAASRAPRTPVPGGSAMRRGPARTSRWPGPPDLVRPAHHGRGTDARGELEPGARRARRAGSGHVRRARAARRVSRPLAAHPAAGRCQNRRMSAVDLEPGPPHGRPGARARHGERGAGRWHTALVAGQRGRAGPPGHRPSGGRYVTYGPVKLRALRARPATAVLWRAGWRWAGVDGRAN